MVGCSQQGQDCCESCRISSAPLNCATGSQMLALGRHRTVQPSGACLSSRKGGDTVANAGGT